MLTDAYDKAMQEYNLAEETMTLEKYLTPIVVSSGNYMYRLTDGHHRLTSFVEGPVVCTTFENLPPKWQDKVAVLQLMEDRELVRGVGYRADEANFLLLDYDVDSPVQE